MDILFDIIAFLFKALVDRNSPNRPASAPPQSRVQAPAQRTQARSQPLLPRNQLPALDPNYDGEGWRLAVTVLAFIILVVIVAVWFAYMQGWLPLA